MMFTTNMQRIASAYCQGALSRHETIMSMFDQYCQAKENIDRINQNIGEAFVNTETAKMKMFAAEPEYQTHYTEVSCFQSFFLEALMAFFK